MYFCNNKLSAEKLILQFPEGWECGIRPCGPWSVRPLPRDTPSCPSPALGFPSPGLVPRLPGCSSCSFWDLLLWNLCWASPVPCSEGAAGLLRPCPQRERNRGEFKGLKLPERRCRWDLGRNSCLRGAGMELQGSCGCLVPGTVQGRVGGASEPPGLVPGAESTGSQVVFQPFHGSVTVAAQHRGRSVTSAPGGARGAPGAGGERRGHAGLWPLSRCPHNGSAVAPRPAGPGRALLGHLGHLRVGDPCPELGTPRGVPEGPQWSHRSSLGPMGGSQPSACARCWHSWSGTKWGDRCGPGGSLPPCWGSLSPLTVPSAGTAGQALN